MKSSHSSPETLIVPSHQNVYLVKLLSVTTVRGGVIYKWQKSSQNAQYLLDLSKAKQWKSHKK